MKVSIITAFYKGNAYMQQYRDMIRKNQGNLQDGDELEAIIVNDSPEEPVLLGQDAADCNIWVVDQPKNGGIHQARVRGLLECTGDYVIFLDQDDVLTEDAVAKMLTFYRQYEKEANEVQSYLGEEFAKTGIAGIMRYPVVVCNALVEEIEGSSLWYRTAYHKKQIGEYKTYLRVGNQIISPGQCMVPRKGIPKDWMTNICRKNGSDDYYLWLLLLLQHTPFVFLDEALYVHKYTAENLSSDSRKMDDSTYEFIGFLKKDPGIRKKDIQLLERTVFYKDRFRRGNLMEKAAATLRNPDIFLANVFFKMRSKTPYGFHRGY